LSTRGRSTAPANPTHPQGDCCEGCSHTRTALLTRHPAPPPLKLHSRWIQVAAKRPAAPAMSKAAAKSLEKSLVSVKKPARRSRQPSDLRGAQAASGSSSSSSGASASSSTLVADAPVPKRAGPPLTMLAKQLIAEMAVRWKLDLEREDLHLNPSGITRLQVVRLCKVLRAPVTDAAKTELRTLLTVSSLWWKVPNCARRPRRVMHLCATVSSTTDCDGSSTYRVSSPLPTPLALRDASP